MKALSNGNSKNTMARIFGSALVVSAIVSLGACTNNRTEGDARPTTPMNDSQTTSPTGTVSGPATTNSEGTIGTQTGGPEASRGEAGTAGEAATAASPAPNQ